MYSTNFKNLFGKIDHINYCLSPGWAPPWSDKKFEEFCDHFMSRKKMTFNTREYDIEQVKREYYPLEIDFKKFKEDQKNDDKIKMV